MSGSRNPSFVSFKHLTNYLMVVSLIGIFVVTQLAFFDGYNYRQDEAWMIHWAITKEPFEIIEALRTSPSLPLYLLLMDGWVAFFGHYEFSTRLLSMWPAVVSLAVVYRLTRDDSDHRSAFVAVVLLSTLNFFIFYTHEARPYSLFVMLAASLLLVINRWFRNPTFLLSAVVVVIGIAGMYTHYYFLLYMGALTFTIAVTRPWFRREYRLIIGLFALIGILFLPQIWVVWNNTISSDGGIGYALPISNLSYTFDIIYNHMRTNPEAIGVFLILSGAITLIVNRKWLCRDLRSMQQRRLQYLLVPLFTLVLSLIANFISPSLTTRNIIIILPPLAVLSALGTSTMDSRIVFVLISMLFVVLPTNFDPIVSNGPYAEVTSFVDNHYQDEGQIVIDASQKWQHAPLIYYLRERTNNVIQMEDMTNFGYFDAVGGDLAETPVNLITESGIVAGFLSNAPEQLFWITVDKPTALSVATQEIVEDQYVIHREIEFDWDWYHRVIEYRRIPLETDPVATLDNNIVLQSWELSDFTISNCKAVTFDSWWTLDEIPDDNYSITVVLANSDGNGVVNSDGSPANTLTQLWVEDQFYLDERSLEIPCDLAPGEYSLLLGWYRNSEEGIELLPMIDQSGNPVDQLFYVTTITVKRD